MVCSERITTQGAKTIKSFQHYYSTNDAQAPSELSPAQMVPPHCLCTHSPWVGWWDPRMGLGRMALTLDSMVIHSLFTLVPCHTGAQLFRTTLHMGQATVRWFSSFKREYLFSNNLEQLLLFLTILLIGVTLFPFSLSLTSRAVDTTCTVQPAATEQGGSNYRRWLCWISSLHMLTSS